MKHKDVKEIEKMYMAGVIDACGHLDVFVSIDKRTGKNRMSLMIWISSVRLVLIESLKEFNRDWHLKKSTHHDRTIYTLVLGNYEDISFFLKLIIQYLIIWRKAAELMIKLCESRLGNRSDGGKYYPYTSAELKLVEEIRYHSIMIRKKEQSM